MKHLFIINPLSFNFFNSIDNFEENIEEHFKNQSNDTWSVHISRYPRDAVSIIKDERTKLDMNEKLRVYSVGGSGTLNDCLNGIAGEENIELACFPFGAFNNFIRTFTKKPSAFLNVKAQMNAATVFTDYFRCNSLYVLNFCAIGIEGLAKIKVIVFLKCFNFIHRMFPHAMGFLFGLCSIISFFNRDVRRQQYEIKIDGKDYSGRYANIFIANGRYHADKYVAAPKAIPNDGYLDVVFLKSCSIIKLLKMWHLYQTGRCNLKPDFFTTITARKIDIRSHNKPIHTCFDGEYFKDSSLQIEIIRNGIQIVIPSAMMYSEGLE